MIEMEHKKQLCVTSTTLVAILVIAYAGVHVDSNAYAQDAGNSSSSTTSMICMNNQPCNVMTCSNNQPCKVSEAPNIESPLEDRLDVMDDILDFD
jgi:hypothetical protein